MIEKYIPTVTFAAALLFSCCLLGAAGESAAQLTSAGYVFIAQNGPDAIGYIRYDGANVNTTWTSAGGNMIGTAVDHVNNKVYYTRFGSGTIGVRNIDGSNQNNTLIAGLGGPTGITIDHTNGKIFWAEQGSGRIGTANPDGSGVTYILTGLGNVRDIAVDPLNNKLYYCSTSSGTIGRANLNGSSHTAAFIATTSTFVGGLTVDAAHGYIYWGDFGGGANVGRATTAGTGINPSFITGGTGTYDVTVDVAHGKIFWTNMNNGTVGRADLDGTAVNQNFATGFAGASGIDVGVSPFVPEINITGNAVSVTDGSASVSASNHTHFGFGAGTRTFTIQNTGSAALSVSNVTITGAAASDFSVTAGPAGSVAPAGSTTFTITFTPTIAGIRDAVVHVNNGDADEGDYDFAVRAIAGNRLYVDLSAAGSNSGVTWTDAFTDFQGALALANAGDTVLVAQGSYKPSIGVISPTPRTRTFTLSNGVTYYGGFPAGGGTFASRDFSAFRTILSGDIGTVNDSTDNCFLVVDARNLTNTTRISGLTIERGNADSSNTSTIYGQTGGINLGTSGSIQLDSVTVRWNFGRYGAGMVGNGTHNASLRGCTFLGNNAGQGSGGAVALNGGSTVFLNTSFTDNRGSNGGAVSEYGASIYTGCSFTANKSVGAAGGGAINGGSGSMFTDCTFSGNTTTGDGGVMYSFYGVHTFTRCLFNQNTAANDGGCIRIPGFTGGVTLDRCVFTGNKATTGVGGTLNISNRDAIVTNCVFWNNSTPSYVAGALYNNGGNMTITNSSFNKNSCGSSVGGAVSNNGGTLNVSNCIFWGNIAGGNDFPPTSEIANYGTLNTSNTIWEGNTTGGTIYNANPFFTNTATGDLTLQDCSAALDTGAANGLVTDVAGAPRPVDVFPGGLSYDLGAYERQIAPVLPEINLKGNGMDIADGAGSPSAVYGTDFGTGASIRTFTVQNTGAAALSVSSVTVTGAQASDFSVSASPASSVGPAGTSTFTITFNPAGTSLRNAVIHVNNSDCDEGDYDFAIQGTGEAGAALDFDGINDRVTLAGVSPISSGTPGQYTVEAMVNIPAYGPDMWIYGDERNANGGILMQINPAGFVWTFKPGAGVVTSTYQVPLNTWTHLAFVQDGVNLKLYANGVFIQNLLTAPNLHVETNQTEYLGAFTIDHSTFSRFFMGRMDEVRVWNYARSCEEIDQRRACELAGTESGLVSYFKFNQGVAGGNNTLTGTNIAFLSNASPTGNNGTLVNFARTGASSNWASPGAVTSGSACGGQVFAAEINLQGNSANIIDGAASPAAANHTDFGNGVSITRTFTIQNSGNTALTVPAGGLTLTGANAADFSAGGITLPASIAAGSFATFTVTFAPSTFGAGARTATVHVASNDCNEGDYDFAVQGIPCNPPTAYTVSGGGAYCSGSAGAVITLSNSETGVNYQLHNGTTTVGSVVAGSTGNAISFTQPAAGTYTVRATQTAGSCTATMSGSAAVTINPTPNAVAAPLSQTICNASAITTIVNSGSVAGTVCNWTRNGTGTVTGIAAGGAGNISGTLTNTTNAPVTVTFTITPSYTNAGTTCSGTPATAIVNVAAAVTATAAALPLYPMPGQEIQTIYVGYPGSAQAMDLSIIPAGGNGPYTYSMTRSGCNVATVDPSFSYSGNTASPYAFTPGSVALCNLPGGDNIYTFKMTAMDVNGCISAVQTKKLNVVNTFKGDSIMICHRNVSRGSTTTQMMTLPVAAIATHLAHGDYLGNCQQFTGAKRAPAVAVEEGEVRVYPNPTTGSFKVELHEIDERADIMITDVQGKIIARRTLAKDALPVADFDLGGFSAGVYFIVVRDGEMLYRTKIVLR